MQISPPPSEAQASSSPPYSPTPSMYVASWETKFHTHAEQKAKL